MATLLRWEISEEREYIPQGRQDVDEGSLDRRRLGTERRCSFINFNQILREPAVFYHCLFSYLRFVHRTAC